MARAMNVDKRVTAAKQILAKTLSSAEKATKMADELTASFAEDKTPVGKNARAVAKALSRLAAGLTKVHGNSADLG